MTDLVKHVEWLLVNRGHELKGVLDKNSINSSVEQALETMQAADPSERKLAVQWIFDSFLKKGFRWEDIAAGQTSKVYETLTIFAQNRMRLNGEARNLSSYKKLSQVFTAVKPYLTPEELKISGREAKRREKQSCLDESLVIWHSESLIVSVPQTERAAKWWGKGTQWCTAANKDNYFNQYNPHAPLIVLTFPQGLKVAVDQEDDWETYFSYKKKSPKFKQQKGASRLQLWIGDDVQFMDEEDGELSEAFLKENWLQISPFIEWMILNPDNKDNSLYTLIGAFNDLSIESLVNMFDQDQQQKIAEKKPEAIGLMRSWNQADKDKLYLKLLATDEIKANVLPQHLWTTEISKKYVLESSANISFVPKKIIDLEFCSGILETISNSQKSLFLKNLADTISSKKLWTKLAASFPIAYNVYNQKFGSAIEINSKPSKESGLRNNKWIKRVLNEKLKPQWIPYEERTTELCEYFLSNHLVKLDFVPNHLITKDFCLLALKMDRCNIWDIPKKLRTDDVYQLAFDLGRCDFSDIPEEEINQQLCEKIISLVIEQNHRDYGYYSRSRLYGMISKDLLEKHRLSTETLEKIVDFNPECINLIPLEQQTKNMVINALKHAQLDKPVNIELLDEKDIIEICKFNRNNISEFEEIMPDLIRNHREELYWKIDMFEGLQLTLQKSISNQESRSNLDNLIKV